MHRVGTVQYSRVECTAAQCMGEGGRAWEEDKKLLVRGRRGEDTLHLVPSHCTLIHANYATQQLNNLATLQ